MQKRRAPHQLPTANAASASDSQDAPSGVETSSGACMLMEETSPIRNGLSGHHPAPGGAIRPDDGTAAARQGRGETAPAEAAWSMMVADGMGVDIGVGGVSEDRSKGIAPSS